MPLSAWLAASAQTYQGSRQGQKDKIRQSCKLEFPSLPQVGIQDHGNFNAIVGVVSLDPKFQGHQSRVLDQEERMQTEFWKWHGVAISSLWFWSVIHILPCVRPGRLEMYCTASTKTRCYSTIHDAECQQELLSTLPFDGDPPAWLNTQISFPVICLPYAFAYQVMRGQWMTMAAPSPFTPPPFSSPLWFRQRISTELKHFFEETMLQGLPDDDQWNANDVFHDSQCIELANVLRSVLHGNPQIAPQLLEWVVRLQNNHDAQFLPSARRTRRPIAILMKYVLLADQLKDMSSIGEVINKACQIVMLPSQYADIQQMQEKARLKVPDKGQISRARLTMDVSMMLKRRCSNFQGPDPDAAAAVRYLSWDSSPQFGRDYVLALIRTIKRRDIKDLLLKSSELYNMWAWLRDDNHDDDEDKFDDNVVKREEEIMKTIRKAVDVHALPCVLVGFLEISDH